MKFAFKVWLFLFIATVAFSQSVSTPQKFSSFYGGYIVELPADAQPFGSGPLDVREKNGFGGKGYGTDWIANDMSLLAGYVEIDPKLTAAGKKAALEQFTKNLFTEARNLGLQIARDESITTNGNEGREIEFEGPYERFICRIYMHDWCIVRLGAFFRSERVKALAFLDSLKLMTREEIGEQKFRDATPTELPAPPIPGKVSDVESYPLKGKVESVLDEKQEPKDGKVLERQMSIKVFFDSKGTLVKLVTWDNLGHPGVVAVYGSLEGMNVQKIGYIHNERVFSDAASARPGEAQKKRDTRYDERIDIKYDKQKRIAERISYDNAGDISSREVFSYGTLKNETVFYASSGKIEARVTEVLDKQKNIVRLIDARLGKDAFEEVSDYKYLAFDSKGNWTKRSVSFETKRTGKDSYRSEYIEYRTITYY